MAKKNKYIDYDDEEDIVLDKKTKRRMERAKNREAQQTQQEKAVVEAEEEAEVEDAGSNTMSQIALLCQENRWREAVLIGRAALREAQENGKDEMVIPLSIAMEKLEMSLRRQIAAVFLSKSKEMLKKEYLLDVGE